MIYFEPMVVPIEKGNSYSSVEKRLLGLEREIGVAACEFIETINPSDLKEVFKLVSTEDERGKIVERAIFRSMGFMHLSGELPKNYDELKQAREGLLICEFMYTSFSDQDFSEIDYRSYPKKLLSLNNTELSYAGIDGYLSQDPRGISLIDDFGIFFQYDRRERGIRFGIDLFIAAACRGTEQNIETLSWSQRAINFLGKTDLLISKYE